MLIKNHILVEKIKEPLRSQGDIIGSNCVENDFEKTVYAIRFSEMITNFLGLN